MIDIHSHILYGIDDGSTSMEESLNIIKKMYDLGFNHIIATPHYIENTEYIADNKTKKLLLNLLEQKLENFNIPVKIYVGNEVFFNENIVEQLLNNELFTLNNSNYILIELPLNTNFTNTLDIFHEIQNRGAKIILAHPERYSYFQNNKKLIDEYIKNGILLQGNIESLSGKYGTHAKKLFTKLLKEKKYFALASDIHRSKSNFFENFEKNKAKIIKLTNKETFNDLLYNNPKKIIGLID